jgi:cyanophycinase
VAATSSTLVEADGPAKVVGEGSAYFLEAKRPPEVCTRKQALRFGGVSVHRVPNDGSFDVRLWRGEGGDNYTLSTRDGKVNAAGSNHGIY